MNKYSIDNLVFEIGRQCNMRCPHCLRGEPENIAIPDKYILDVLDNLEYITYLTITGGEPFLYPQKIKLIVDKIINDKIAIDSFFVATNGTVESPLAVMSLLRLYSICEEPEICSLKISADDYHSKEKNTWRILDGLSFAYKDEKTPEEKYLIAEGRAKDNYDCDRTACEENFEINNNHIDGLIYIAANGNILKGCDYSYKTQEKLAFGNLKNNSFDEILTLNVLYDAVVGF